MGQDGAGEILSQFPQPIQEICDARGVFKVKEFFAVGSGSAHQIGNVDTCVLHGFTVPVDKALVVFFQTP